MNAQWTVVTNWNLLCIRICYKPFVNDIQIRSPRIFWAIRIAGFLRRTIKHIEAAERLLGKTRARLFTKKFLEESETCSTSCLLILPNISDIYQSRWFEGTRFQLLEVNLSKIILLECQAIRLPRSSGLEEFENLNSRWACGPQWVGTLPMALHKN